MHEVEQTEYGLRLTLRGFIEEGEMNDYCEAIKSSTDEQVGSFRVVADMRETTAMPDDSAAELKQVMGYCDQQGLERAAGIVESATTAIQLQQMAENVNHADGETIFIDASEVDDWESEALKWVQQGVEPAGTW
jgi:hypothetical protein